MENLVMFRKRFLSSTCTLVAALVAVGAGLAWAAEAEQPDPAKQKELALIAVLESDKPAAEKAIPCKRLAICGTKDAVPALAALLPDAELASWARIALEAIPGPEADAALRDAMDKVQGRLLVGVINSIGVRADAEAVDGLTKKLKDRDVQVAAAAAVALGRIGNAAAAKAVEQALAGGAPEVRSSAAEGCVLCAEKALAGGNAAEAARLYEAVRKADVPKQRVVEATRGLILAQGKAGVPLLVELLESEDKDFFRLGLRVARELPAGEVAGELVAALDKATPERRALLILALADRGDKAALPAVLEAAQSGPTLSRIAAIRVLKRLGTAACVPVLLEAAQSAEDDLAQAAVDALSGLSGKDVDAELASRLSKSEGKVREVLVQLAGLRRVEAATPMLKEAAGGPNASIRSAALLALGSTVGQNDLAFLIERVVAPKNPEDAVPAGQALRAAAQRMPDREACAAALVAAMSRAEVPVKIKLLEILSLVGGQKAVQAVGAAAKDANPEIQDAASRLLGEWMGVDAAPVLLDLAKTATDGKYKIRALRGYIRLARQFDMPERQRAEICRSALEVAERDEEKKLVLEVLERYPNMDTLKLATEAAKGRSLKDEASAVALRIAKKIGGAADAPKLLAQMGQKPVKVEIIKAEYGAEGKFKDVTEVLRRHATNYPLIVLPSSGYNEALGGDPVPSVVKQLKVQYRIDGKPGEVSLAEDAPVLLPVPK
jgi:HEAT repeat protein